MIDGDRRAALGRGLSAKILAVTVLVLLIGEILIFVPSIARFRETYLFEQIARAHLTTLALKEGGIGVPSIILEDALLYHTGALAITISDPNPTLMLGKVGIVDRTYDLGHANSIELILHAFEALWYRGERTIQVIGPAPIEAGTNVTIVVPEAPMWVAMVAYAWRIVGLSLVLSVIVASLVFFSLQRMIVRPLANIAEELTRFRASPEDASLEGTPSRRQDEIGIVDRELHEMQHDLRQALAQKTRLAALGEAVSKINHDLRNMLSSAVLVSDRLELSDDPEIRKTGERLFRMLDRATRLCQATLDFARSKPVTPRSRDFSLYELVEEVTNPLNNETKSIIVDNKIDRNLTLHADRDQIYRVFNNLVRNADHAMPEGGHLRFEASQRQKGDLVMKITDSGDGVPVSSRQRLFEPFAVTASPNGSGLGLAICREIMRSHGGDISLGETGNGGTTFDLVLPAHALAGRR